MTNLLKFISRRYKGLLLAAWGLYSVFHLGACCYGEDDGDDDCYCCYEPKKEWGYKPIYSTDPDDIIRLEDPQALKNPGKIYSFRNYLLVNEVNRGFHIIDNSDPGSPVQTQFLRIEGSNDVAIRNGVIYADQFQNLVIVRLDSLTEVIEKKFLPNVLENYGYYDIGPDIPDVYYECPDPYSGVVVDWYADSVEYPCYAY